jgi:molybdate/tungstate transport system ATP-binding protein
VIEAVVKKRIGNFSLDATINDSGFICITGKNGSGKTSLLNCISGVYHVDSGWVRLNGREVTSLPIHKRKIVLVTYNSFIPHLDVEKHLLFGFKYNRNKDKSILEFVKQRLIIDCKGIVKNLSLGNKSRVSLATAMVSCPELILVDEIFSNLDNKEEFIELYKKIAKSYNIDVIYTTQHQEDAVHSDHHYHMDQGRMTRLL